MALLKQALSAKMAGHNRTALPSNGMQSIFKHYYSDAYASAYPSIRAIAGDYMQVKPYAIDKNGKRVDNNAIINALYHPNQLDSSVSFFEKIAVSTLFHRKTYLLVWRKENGEAKPGGDFSKGNGENIAGYTFLEYPSITRRDNQTFYKIGAQEFSDREVIVLPGGVDPSNLYAGYSPSEASRRWAKLDDYIADFQSGFFENGAVPAGVITVTAATPQEYNDIVDTIEERHKGAGKNGKVTFAHRPVDQTGKPVDAQIEWTPFSEKNRDIGLKEIFDQTNNKIDLAYGVPQIVKGVDDAATYANAQVAERGYAKRAVYPLLLRNYTQFNHELNRITNGTGIAIAFDYEIPTVADEEKVEAETKQVEAAIITSMTMNGFSLDSIVDAFKLSNSYKLLKQGNTATKIENDKPDVDEGGEVTSSPDPDKIDGITPVNKVKMELTDEEKLKKVAMDLLKAQVKQAVAAVDSVEDVAEDILLDEFVNEAMAILQGIVEEYGESQTQNGIALLLSLDKSAELVTDFVINERQLDRYRGYLKMVGTSYSEDTTKAIRQTLERAKTDQLTAYEIKKELNKLPELEGYRAERLARTETVRAQGNGSLYAMEQIQASTGYDIMKVWNVSSDACEFCQEMAGKKISIEQPFLAVGNSVMAGDKILVNNFTDVETADLHPNDRCYITYEVL